MRSAWAGGLHLRSRMDGRRGAGKEVNTVGKAHSSTTDTNARGMLLPAYPVRKPGVLLEAFVVSVGVVALAELGDKTQLLALVLAARFRAPLPVLGGILTATLANHLAAGAVGTLLAAYVSPAVMRWALALSFLATALWMLIPDKAPRARPEAGALRGLRHLVVSFFLLEIGDKTQIATVALAARYSALLPVVAGTTLGMMLADVPVVLLGEVAATAIPMQVGASHCRGRVRGTRSAARPRHQRVMHARGARRAREVRAAG